MKKFFFISFLIAPLLIFAQKDQYTITGTIGKLNAPVKVYLVHGNGSAAKLDSATLQNGSFVIKGEVTNPVPAHLVLSYLGTKSRRALYANNPDIIDFYLEKGKITVTSADSAKNAMVIGSEVNEQFNRYKQSIAVISAKIKSLNAEYSQASADKAMTLYQSLSQRHQVLSNELNSAKATYIKNNPESIVSLYLVINMGSGNTFEVEKVEPMFNLLSSDVKKLTPAEELSKRIAKYKTVAIGAIAPDFIQPDTKGNPVKLSNFRGKYVLVDFWASWCHPCRSENPNVVKAFNNYKDKNFTVLGVSLDAEKTKDAWLKAIEDDHLTWNHVSDLKGWKNDASKLYLISVVPSNFLINPEGVIIAKNLRGEDLQVKLKEIFK